MGRAQTHDCTDDCVRLDVRWLKRQGLKVIYGTAVIRVQEPFWPWFSGVALGSS